MDQGQLQQALELYNLAERDRPHTATLKNNIAWAIATRTSLQGPESLERALRLARTAIAIDPHPHWIDTLAAVYAARGQFEMAIQTEKSGHNNPDRLKAYAERKPPQVSWAGAMIDLKQSRQGGSSYPTKRWVSHVDDRFNGPNDFAGLTVVQGIGVGRGKATGIIAEIAA